MVIFLGEKSLELIKYIRTMIISHVKEGNVEL